MSDNEVFSHPKSPELKHQRIFPHATYSPWCGDAEFQRVYQAVRNNTGVDIYRLYELWSLATQLTNVEGCFLEVGVMRGGSGALLAFAAGKSTPPRRVYLADTFQGVVKPCEQDTWYQGGEHSVPMDFAQKLLAANGLTNATLLKGVFPEDTAGFVGGKVALLHCDVDVYQGSKDIVEWALPRLSVGGVIVFDDYGFYGHEGVVRYASELQANQNLFFIHNLNGHALFVKLRE